MKKSLFMKTSGEEQQQVVRQPPKVLIARGLDPSRSCRYATVVRPKS